MEAQDESLSSSSVGSSGTTASINESHAPNSYDVNSSTSANLAEETSPAETQDNKRNSTTNIMEKVDDKSTIGIDNPGFDDDEEKKEIQDTPKSSKSKNGKSNNGVFLNSPAVDTSMLTEVNLSQNGSDIKDKEMAEAVNLELVNMNPYKAGEKEGVHGIPVKKTNGGEGASGNYHDPYDEYFVPVNEHRKYMRGEKLYVTKDKRRPESRKKCICWAVGFVIIVIAILIAILAGTGVILSNEDNMILNESSSRQFGSDIKAAGVGNLPGRRPSNVSSTPSPASSTVGLNPPTTDMTPLYVPRVIEGEMVIDNEEFAAALADHNSPEFKKLAATLQEELKNALFDQSTLNYGSADIFVKVLDFSSGSIVVKYRVGWIFKEGIRNPPDPIEKDAMRERLETHLGRLGGFLDKYHLTTGSVRASNVINNCQFNNGDCSHECVFDYKSNLNFMCKCPEGFELDTDGKNCHAEEEYDEYDLPEATPKPSSGEPKAEPEPTSEEPKAEPEPTSEEPKAEPEPTSEEPKAEPSPTSEEPKAEPEPTSEEPKSEPEPSSGEPKSEPEPTSEEPKSEPEPSSGEPKSEPEPTSEEPKSEPEPSSEEPKSEPEPSSEEPKSEPEPTPEPNAEPESSSKSHNKDESTETVHLEHMHIDHDHVHKEHEHMHKDNEHDYEDNEQGHNDNEHDHKIHEHDHKDNIEAAKAAVTTMSPEFKKEIMFVSHDFDHTTVEPKDKDNEHDHKNHEHDHKDNIEDKAAVTTMSPEAKKDIMFIPHDQGHMTVEPEHKDGNHVVGSVDQTTMKQDRDAVGITEKEEAVMEAGDHVGMSEKAETEMKKDMIGVVGGTDMPMEHTTINADLLMEVDESPVKHTKELEKEHKSKNKGNDEKKLFGHWDEHTTTGDELVRKETKNKTIVDFLKDVVAEKKQGKKNISPNHGEDPRLEQTTTVPVISMDGDFWDSISSNGDHLKEKTKAKDSKDKDVRDMEKMKGEKSKEEMMNEDNDDKEKMGDASKESVSDEAKTKKENKEENKDKNLYWLEDFSPETENDTSLNALAHDDYDYHNSFKQSKNDTKSGLKKRPRLDKDEMHVKNSNEEKNTFTTEKTFETIPEIIRTVAPLETVRNNENKTNEEPNNILNENKTKTEGISDVDNLHSNELPHVQSQLNNNSESSRQFPSDVQFEKVLMTTFEPMQESSTVMNKPEETGSTEFISDADQDFIDEVFRKTDDKVSPTNDDKMTKQDMTDLPPTLATLMNKKIVEAMETPETSTDMMSPIAEGGNKEFVVEATTLLDDEKNNVVMVTTTTKTPMSINGVADSESSSTNVMDSSTMIAELVNVKLEPSSTETNSHNTKAEDSTEHEITGLSEKQQEAIRELMNTTVSSDNRKDIINDDNRFANDLHSFVTLAESNMTISSPVTTELPVSNTEMTAELKVKNEITEKSNETLKDVSEVDGNSSVTESVVYISDDNNQTTKKSVAHEDNVFGDSVFSDYSEDDVENKLQFASGSRTEKTTLSTESSVKEASDGNIKTTTERMTEKEDKEKLKTKDEGVNKNQYFEKDISVVPLKPEKKTNKKSNKFSENSPDSDLSQFDKKSGDKNQKYDKESSQKNDRLGLAAGFDYNSDPYKMFDDYEGLDLNKDTENPMKTVHTTLIPDTVPETTVFDDKSKSEESSTVIPKADILIENKFDKTEDDKKDAMDNSNDGKVDERANKAIEKDSKINEFVKPLAEGLEPAYNTDVKETTKSTNVIDDVPTTTAKTAEIATTEATVSMTTEAHAMVKNASDRFGGMPPVPLFSKCASGQFQCVNGTSRDGSYCVAASTRCDSINDCTDGSDENGCTENGCPGNFQCANGQCLKRHLVCNDVVDCDDGSDELECQKWKCQFDEFQCPTGRCIPVLWQCDGKPDCANHTDERNCQTTCGNSEYLCPEGWCIPMTWRCNGVPECSSGEDEKLCDCSLDQFKCNTGGCVDKQTVCDGIDHCPDASDEWDCIRLHSDTMQLEIRSPSNAWSPVCKDNWDSLWSDVACQNLGYSKAIFTEYKQRASADGSYALTGAALAGGANNKNPKLAAALANATSCVADAMVEISCQDFTCGSHSLAGGVAARVVGGDRATNGQWPSVALLYHTKHKSSCTASIISPKWLLSSYHCLHQRDKQLLPHSWVVFGGGSMFETDKPETQIKEIRSIIPYPQVKYNQFQYNNDIVLIELGSALVFNRYIGAICLPDKEIEPRQLCVTAGWGYTSPGEINFSQYLHYLPVPTIDLKECNSSKHYAGFITGDEICAGFTDSEKSPCYNDEGAPLMCVSEGGVWELQGVLSYHSNCGRGYHPSIFSSITAVRGWVEKTIGSRFERKSTFNVR